MLRRAVHLIVLSLLGILLFSVCKGCDNKGASRDEIRLEGIERVVIYDVSPSRNPGVYTESIEELSAYTHANFDVEVFRNYINASEYSIRLDTFHMGGNLIIVMYKDSSAHRMMIVYTGSLRSREKGIYVSEDESAKNAFKKEHRRILVEVFIPQRK